MGYGGAPTGAKPTLRNAFVIGIVPLIVSFLGSFIFSFLAGMLDIPALGIIGSVIQLAMSIWLLINLLKCLDEMRNAAGNPAFPRWPIIVPIYNLIYMLMMVPKEMQKAKQMRGMQPTTRNLALYFFFPVFALQSDLNDLAQ